MSKSKTVDSLLKERDFQAVIAKQGVVIPEPVTVVKKMNIPVKSGSLRVEFIK